MTKTKHPKNKAERRLIDHKKKKKKGPVMRDIIISEDNINAAIESFLYSMRLCNADEKVVSFCPLEDGSIGVSLKTVQEDNTNN